MKNMLEQSFVSDMTIPDGKLANMIAFLTYVNLIRGGNTTINKDSAKDVSKFIADGKHIITGDTAAAWAACRESWISSRVFKG